MKSPGRVSGRQSSSSDEGKPDSPASWDTPPPSILQAVAYKAIPCVELKVIFCQISEIWSAGNLREQFG